MNTLSSNFRLGALEQGGKREKREGRERGKERRKERRRKREERKAIQAVT